jgi:Kef-type K+ transport system membrane component KefB
MKQTISAAGTPVPASVKLGTILSWAMLFALIMNLKKRLPEPWKDVIPVEKVEDVKMCILLILCFFFVFALAGAYDVINGGEVL